MTAERYRWNPNAETWEFRDTTDDFDDAWYPSTVMAEYGYEDGLRRLNQDGWTSVVASPEPVEVPRV